MSTLSDQIKKLVAAADALNNLVSQDESRADAWAEEADALEEALAPFQKDAVPFFDNKMKMSDAQAKFFGAMVDCKPLEQTRSGNILFCDLKNPYKPFYILTSTGGSCLVYAFYDIP
jgi:hypothetical protein